MKEEKLTNFTLTKEGVFLKPKLEDYNESVKKGVYFHRKQIEDEKQRAKWKLEQLQKRMQEIRKFRDERIMSERESIRRCKEGLTREEFEAEAIRAENFLREVSK